MIELQLHGIDNIFQKNEIKKEEITNNKNEQNININSEEKIEKEKNERNEKKKLKNIYNDENTLKDVKNIQTILGNIFPKHNDI